MTKLTAADRKSLKAKEDAKQDLLKAAFRSELPMKLLALMARAQSRSDVSYAVHNPEGGVLRVSFEFNSNAVSHRSRDDFHRDDGSNDSEVYDVYLTSEEWDVQRVEDELKEREAADRERERMLKVAKDAYDNLSEEQRTALGVRRPY